MFSQRLATNILLEKSQQPKQEKLFLIDKVQRMTAQWFETSNTSRSIPRPPRTGGTDTKGAGDRR